eukprot:gene11547-21779_t
MVGRYKIENGGVSYSNSIYDTRQKRIWEHYGNNISASKVSWRTIFSDIDEAAYKKETGIKYNETLPVSPTVSFWQSRASDPVLAITESIFSPTELKIRPDLEVVGLYMGKLVNHGFPAGFYQGALVIDNPAHEQTDPDGTIWTTTVRIQSPTTTKIDDLEAAIAVYKIRGRNRTMVTKHVLGKYNLTKCSSLTQEDLNIMPGYSHFIQTTERYILVPQTSYRFDYCQSYKNRGKIFPGFHDYVWHPRVNASILVFDRNDMSKVQEVYLPYAKFFTHDVNAYEDSTHIYLDTLAYDNADAYLKVPVIKEVIANLEWNTSIIRIAIDKRSWSYDEAKSEALTAQDPFGRAEFPMINYEQHHQKDYTYTYFVENALYREAKIVKLNVKTKSIIRWIPPVGFYPQEPIFIQRDGGTGEDDGVILCSGPVSMPAGTSFLAILNATDLSQIALVKNPSAAPFGLHNRFYKATPAVATTKITSSQQPDTTNRPGTNSKPGTTKRPATTVKASGHRMHPFVIHEVLLACLLLIFYGF